MTTEAELEALGHELFKGKAINHQAWRLDDKVWVKQREGDWKSAWFKPGYHLLAAELIDN